MLTYAQFAERLARGPLKNTSAVDETNLGEICPDYAATVLNLTNQGLVDLTTRLPLIKRLVDLTFVADQFVYNMAVASAYLDTTGLDTFVDAEFVKILDVYDSDGKRYQPNSGGHITTPLFNTVRFSAAYRDDDGAFYIGPTVRLQYQALHTPITVSDNIDLPPNLVAALQQFVASQYITDMGGKDHSRRGDELFALYLRSVTEDVIGNVSGTSEVEGQYDRFVDGGWV